MFRGSPSTCFGETLKAGTMRLAEFCLIKSVGLLIIFAIDAVVSLMNLRYRGVYLLLPFGLLVLSVVKIVCNIFLYKGARDGIPRYMKPWFWVYSIQTGLILLLAIGGAIALEVSFPVSIIPVGFLFIFSLIYCTASKYFCQVVLGLIRELERGKVGDDSVRPVIFSNEIA